MSAKAELMAIASEVAGHAQNKEPRLQKQLAEIEAQKLKIDAALNAARLAKKRLADYPGLIGGHPICPRCWIDNGTQATMRPRNSPSAHKDRFHCDGCGLDVDISPG